MRARGEVGVAYEDEVVEHRRAERRERRPPDEAAVGHPAHPRRSPDGSREPHPAARRQVCPAPVVERPAPRLGGDPGPAVDGPDPLAVGVRLPADGHARLPVLAVARIGLPRAVGTERLLIGARRRHGVGRRRVLRWRGSDERDDEENGQRDAAPHPVSNTHARRSLRAYSGSNSSSTTCIPPSTAEGNPSTKREGLPSTMPVVRS